MPVISLSMVKGRTEEQKLKMVSSIRKSLVESFSLPDNSFSIRFMEFERKDFYLPEPKSQDYILFEMDCFTGRSSEAKEELCKQILSEFSGIGEDSDQILVIIRDMPLENWGYKK